MPYPTMTQEERSEFMVGIATAILQIKPWPVRETGCTEAEQQQLAIIRQQENAWWVEKNLTDDQRMERARQEIKMRNDQLRGVPTCFGALE